MSLPEMNAGVVLSHFEREPGIDRLHLPYPGLQEMTLDLVRLDQLHPFISGNKWFKLQHHLQAAMAAGKTQLLSFGGAYSNHLHALACLGRELNIPTIGIVRGEPPATLTPTLQDCVNWGMQIEWLARQSYRHVAERNAEAYTRRFPDAWIIPEGGGGEAGAKGVRELFERMFRAGRINHDYIVCPVGSGTTLAGLATAELGDVECIGFSVLKGARDLEQKVAAHFDVMPVRQSWRICHDYHFGGYARINPRLTGFISEIHSQHELLLDPVYTGKMLFGLVEWAGMKLLPPNARVLLLHTGGLQGWRGFASGGAVQPDAPRVE